MSDSVFQQMLHAAYMVQLCRAGKDLGALLGELDWSEEIERLRGCIMADAYLEVLDDFFRRNPNIVDLHEVAEKLGLPFESLCLAFNNGLLKGYWKILLMSNDVE